MRLFYFGLLFSVAGILPCRAQDFTEKIIPRLGASINVIGITYPDGTGFFSSPSLPFYSIAGGAYYAYAHSNDMYSIGLDPSVHLALGFTSPVSIMLQTPVFLAARVGQGATRYNESSVGFGLGIGGNFTYARIAYTDMSSGRSSTLEAPFLAPAAMAELNLLFNNPITIRFLINLTKTRQSVDAGLGLQRQLDFSNWGLGLLYAF
ncbi:MAG: hypothetical protein KF690_00860 [Bacteroidetes bacterium]|nr:hypothetical protein [Bacteroidota bacterium]